MRHVWLISEARRAMVYPRSNVRGCRARFDGKLGKHYPNGLNVKNSKDKVWASRVDSELFVRLEGDENAVEGGTCKRP